MDNHIQADLLAARHSPYTFPGGYSLVGLVDDGEVICGPCLKESEVHVGGESDGLRIEAITVIWEGPPNYCSICNSEMPTEYGLDYEDDL